VPPLQSGSRARGGTWTRAASMPTWCLHLKMMIRVFLTPAIEAQRHHVLDRSSRAQRDGQCANASTCARRSDHQLRIDRRTADLAATQDRSKASREAGNAPTFDIYMILESALLAGFIWAFAKAAAFTLGVYYLTH
jgi:hypothetical protein